MTDWLPDMFAWYIVTGFESVILPIKQISPPKKREAFDKLCRFPWPSKAMTIAMEHVGFTPKPFKQAGSTESFLNFGSHGEQAPSDFVRRHGVPTRPASVGDRFLKCMAMWGCFSCTYTSNPSKLKKYFYILSCVSGSCIFYILELKPKWVTQDPLRAA